MFTGGIVQRPLILVGLLLASVVYAILTSGLAMGPPLDVSGIAGAAWFGAPAYTAPRFDGHAMLLIAPVAIILVAENLGHLKAVTAMTGRNLDPLIGRAFIDDGVATLVRLLAGPRPDRGRDHARHRQRRLLAQVRQFAPSGIGTATFGAIMLRALLGRARNA